MDFFDYISTKKVLLSSNFDHPLADFRVRLDPATGLGYSAPAIANIDDDPF